MENFFDNLIFKNILFLKCFCQIFIFASLITLTKKDFNDMVKNIHWGSAKIQAAPQLDSVAGLYDDGQTWPEAIPYIHEEIIGQPFIGGPEERRSCVGKLSFYQGEQIVQEIE